MSNRVCVPALDNEQMRSNATGPLDVTVSNSRLVSNLSREGLQCVSRLAQQWAPPPAPPAPRDDAAALAADSRRRQRRESAAGAEAAGHWTKDEVHDIAQRCAPVVRSAILQTPNPMCSVPQGNKAATAMVWPLIRSVQAFA